MLLDTCALIWWTLDPAQLSLKTRKLLDAADHVYVSAISIAELGIKIKKKQLELPLSLRDYVQRLYRSNISILPVTDSIILDSLDLKWVHSDPVDRIIVATAKHEKWAIVTKDDEIKKYYKRTIG